MELSGIQSPHMEWTSTNLPDAYEKFERHVQLMFSGPLKEKSEPEKVSYFLLWIGDRGRDIHSTWRDISAEDAKQLNTYYTRFRAYVQPKLNPIFARYKFSNQTQDDESIDAFVTRLRICARDCNFRDSDEMIRDRIVFGTSSSKVREKLINEGASLTLDKAIQTAQNIEYSKKQMDLITGPPVDREVHRVNQKERSGRNEERPHGQDGSMIRKCQKCGKKHNKHKLCPAKGKKCFKCGKINHFSEMCRTDVNNVRLDSSSEDEDFSICTVKNFDFPSRSDSAMVTVHVGKSSVPLRFKVDTGSQCNLIPKDLFQKLKHNVPIHRSDHKLTSYTNNQIPVYGKVNLPCKYGGKQVNAGFYVVGKKCTALLSLQTSVDLGLIKLTFAVDEQPRTLDKQNVLREYGDLFQGIGLFPGTCTLHLKPNSVPVMCPPRRVPVAFKERLKKELNSMEQKGIIKKVTEPTDWVNALVCVEKATSGKLRVCLDPKALNECILRPHYPIRTIEDVMTKLTNAKYFSVLDATMGYWSIKLTEESSYLTTFNSPFGRYRYLRLPMGIKSSQDIFSQKIDEFFEDLPGVTSIIDDILVFGQTQEEHDRHLRSVLQRAREKGIRFNPEKCVIGSQEVKYFGHIMTSEGIKPDPEKIRAIVGMKVPENKSELETLLGMITYLSKFDSHLAHIVSPMRDLMKKDVVFVWDSMQDQAFEKVKKAITEAPVLAYYDPEKPITLQVDSSSKGIEATCLQEGRPINFASKTLTPTEQGYAQIEKEMLAILFGLTRFKQYCYGRHTKIETDHKPLVSIMKKPLCSAPPRLQRMLFQIQNFDLEFSLGKFGNPLSF